MMWPQLQGVVQIVIGRTLNSLPEGLLIALFAWATLRLLPRQNSGTRFAVWFVALLAVAGLPVAEPQVIGLLTAGHAVPLLGGQERPLITLSPPWGLLLLSAWALAAGIAILRLTLGLWRLRTLRRSCIAIDPAELGPSIEKSIADFSSSRSVTLATSEKVSVPAAIGFFKPIIVIPTWTLRELPPEQLNVVVLHELAHLRRWDDWTNLLQKVVRAVFLFHPAVWWIERRLSLEREMACDDQVVAETANPHAYAKCLIALLEKTFMRRSWAMAQAAVHRAREASLRLERILDANRTNTRHVWKPALGLMGAFALACLMVVPRTPQFVTFEQNADTVHALVPNLVPSAQAHSAGLTGSQLHFAAVIPAAMRTRPSRLPAPGPRLAAAQNGKIPTAEHLGEYAPTTPKMVVEHLRTDRGPNPAEPAAIGAQEKVVPGETLLVLRTTQRIGPNSWVCSVSVWRITWKDPAPEGSGRGPDAKKT